MNNDEIKNSGLVRALSRRRFLLGAAGLTVTTLAAGCGGGGSGDGDYTDYFDWTYRDIDEGRNVAAAITVDTTGLLTYWTLRADPVNPFADFDQTPLGSDRRFEVTSLPEEGNVRTLGEFRRGDRARGRTEDAANSSFGFDWEALRAGEPSGTPPADDLIGSFAGSATVQGIGVIAFVGVSSDGNATVLAAFDDPVTQDVDFFAFESLSFDRFGNGYDYFLNLYDDQIDLRILNGGISLLYTFDPDDPGVGEFAGETFEVPLQRTGRSAAARSLRLPRAKTAGAPGLDRIVRAFRARDTKNTKKK